MSRALVQAPNPREAVAKIKYVGNEQEKRSLQMEGLNLMDKTLSVQGARISFSIWDVADSVAILIMFDLTSRCTLHSVVRWYSEARKWNQNAIPILIGTKFDDFVKLTPDLQWTIVTQLCICKKPKIKPLTSYRVFHSPLPHFTLNLSQIAIPSLLLSDGELHGLNLSDRDSHLTSWIEGIRAQISLVLAKSSGFPGLVSSISSTAHALLRIQTSSQLSTISTQISFSTCDFSFFSSQIWIEGNAMKSELQESNARFQAFEERMNSFILQFGGQMPSNQARAYARAMKAALFFSSATHNINVNKIFKFIMAKLFNLPWTVERNLTLGEPIIDF
ncbi:uncharacterized protein LOC130746749 [Lotus japonicus]|uniref:uncharacterized protein LOC130746749 n=1 Tax=Lotus japonicus TaxID=34305 RepID=UPI00258863F2|nr:uncharacterized protein LOC130746749 [Lotus japonicus]